MNAWHMVMMPKANVMKGRSQCEPPERLVVHFSSRFAGRLAMP